MKGVFRVFARILLVFVCVALFLGIAGGRAAPTVHASSCSWHFLDNMGTFLSDGHYLYAELDGLYDSNGYFCGQMRGYASESAPAHTTDGWLSIYLYACGGTLKAYNYTSVQSGGLYGTSGYIYGSAASVSCGYAYASFSGKTVWQISGSVQTGSVIG
jgi:hypothetical protein